jgi:type III secretion protein U
VSDKTEEPTPRRLRKAREEGDSGASAYAAQSVAFVVAVALVPVAARSLAQSVAAELRAAIAASAGALSPDTVVRCDAVRLATTFVALCLPVLVAAGVAGAVVHVVQTGGAVASKRLGLKLERLNPAQGLKNLVSGTRLFAVARALLAGTVVCWLAWIGLRDRIGDVGRLAGRSGAGWTAAVVSEVAVALAWRAGLVGLGLAVVDILVTRRAWLRRLRMSKDEVRRETKESEGDPHVKAARERAYQELVAQATIANVRTASVVVVNPTHLACALRYAPGGAAAPDESGDEAPVVVASGRGDVAARIVRAAHDWAIPVVCDVPLARALVDLSVGDAIPEALYEAVAEILREVGQISEHDSRSENPAR